MLTPSGEAQTEIATDVLVRIAARHSDDPYLLAAVWSSVDLGTASSLSCLQGAKSGGLPTSLRDPAIRLVNSLGSDADLMATAQALTDRSQHGGSWQFDAAAKLLEQCRRRAGVDAQVQTAFAPMIEAARQTVESSEGEANPLPALRLLAASGRGLTSSPSC